MRRGIVIRFQFCGGLCDLRYVKFIVGIFVCGNGFLGRGSRAIDFKRQLAGLCFQSVCQQGFFVSQQSFFDSKLPCPIPFVFPLLGQSRFLFSQPLLLLAQCHRDLPLLVDHGRRNSATDGY